MGVREKTVCFTGHRPEKICQPFDENAAPVRELRHRLQERILRAVDEGYTTFLCGMARGVDLWAGEMVLALQEPFRRLELVAVQPYPAQFRRWPPEWGKRYERVLRSCDEVVTISPAYRPDCYHRRDRYMVDHASRLIGVWREGSPGGTAYTIDYARRSGQELDLLLL